MDLWREIEQKIKELDVSVKALRKTGTEFATAERDYKKRLREEALKLKSDVLTSACKVHISIFLA